MKRLVVVLSCPPCLSTAYLLYRAIMKGEREGEGCVVIVAVVVVTVEGREVVERGRGEGG